MSKTTVLTNVRFFVLHAHTFIASIVKLFYQIDVIVFLQIWQHGYLIPFCADYLLGVSSFLVIVKLSESHEIQRSKN